FPLSEGKGHTFESCRVRHFHKTGHSKNPPFLRLMRPQFLQASTKRERLHQFPLSFVWLDQFHTSIRRAFDPFDAVPCWPRLVGCACAALIDLEPSQKAAKRRRRI